MKGCVIVDTSEPIKNSSDSLPGCLTIYITMEEIKRRSVLNEFRASEAEHNECSDDCFDGARREATETVALEPLEEGESGCLVWIDINDEVARWSWGERSNIGERSQKKQKREKRVEDADTPESTENEE